MSVGGLIALTIAEQYGDMVGHVVLTDATPYSAAGYQVAKPLAPLLLSGMGVQLADLFPYTPAGNAGLCRYLDFKAVLPSKEDTPTVQEEIAGAKTELLLGSEAAALPYFALFKMTNPTLVIHGSLDEIIAVADGQAIADAIPGASLFQFADSGHATILQHGADCVDLIDIFLDYSNELAETASE